MNKIRKKTITTRKEKKKRRTTTNNNKFEFMRLAEGTTITRLQHVRARAISRDRGCKSP